MRKQPSAAVCGVESCLRQTKQTCRSESTTKCSIRTSIEEVGQADKQEGEQASCHSALGVPCRMSMYLTPRRRLLKIPPSHLRRFRGSHQRHELVEGSLFSYKPLFGSLFINLLFASMVFVACSFDWSTGHGPRDTIEKGSFEAIRKYES